MRWPIPFLLLLACTAPTPPPTDEAPKSETEAWSNPAEAEDTNPEPDHVEVRLTADFRNFTVGETEVEGYAYNGQNPGPTIRMKVGDTLQATLVNNLDVPTTIHWHGLSVPYEMDGVTWSEDPVGPGESFEYRFTVNQAGTFWYHPHFDTERQVDLGLYGMLIVEDPEAPPVAKELNLVMDSWGDYHSDPNHRHYGTIRSWTVNGLEQPEIPVNAGDVIHMRILNASNIGYLSLSGPFRIIAGDQGWLPEPQSPEFVVLAPGDRIETEWVAGSEDLKLMHTPYAMHGGGAYGDAIPMATLVPTGDSAAPLPPSWPTLDGPPSPDAPASDLVYIFQGDDSSGSWMINGEVFPEITVHTLEMGTEAIIEVRNMSSVEHPFHLHGFHFEVLSTNGVPSAYRRIEDTLNLKIRDRVKLKILVNNPGFWMAHCHILPHAHGGMMTVIEVPNDSEEE